MNSITPFFLSPDQVLSIAASGTFQGLIGLQEDARIDVKVGPYRFENSQKDDETKYELAKDVSSLANAEGGLLVFGCKSKCLDESPQEYVDAIRPFENDLLDVERYHKIPNEWVVPNILGVSVRWHESKTEPGKGIATLCIPPSVAQLAPYLVRFTLTPDKKRQGTQFSHHVRSFGHNHLSSAEFLQAQLRFALRFPDIVPRLDSIESCLAKIMDSNVMVQLEHGATTSPQMAGLQSEEVLQRIKQAQITLDRDGMPNFVLAATPENGVRFERLFSSSSEPVVATLDNLKSTRKDGFSIETYQPSTIVGNRLRRRMEPGLYLIELWQDGLFLAIGPGDEHLLSRQRASTAHLEINSLALAEATYDFAVQAYSLFSYAIPSPLQLQLLVSLENMMRDGNPVALSNSRVSNQIAFRQPRVERQAHFLAESSEDFSSYDPGRVAFELVGQIYNHFGYNRDQMPYVEKGQERITANSLFEVP